MNIRCKPRERSSCQKADLNVDLPVTLTQTVIDRIRCLSPSREKVRYLQNSFLEKFSSHETDPADVRRQRAINKWLSVERDNEATNDRLLTTPGEYNILPRVTLQSFLVIARRLVLSILGETIPLDVLHGSFSGGASTSKTRTESHPAMKYLGQADITPAAVKWFSLVMEESPAWYHYSDQMEPRLVQGNVMFTVPKSTEIDRCACKEPDLNMYLQKGVGNYIRWKLRRVGIDLNDQSRNQQLARKGSIDNSLATLDLSSASDSVSSGLVQILLPDLWFGFLDDLRSPMTQIDGEWHENHMFSSMGNGFTFELESLIFWALARTVRHFAGCSGIVSVYGDDIIVESEYAEDLSWVLGFFGFSVNMKKSFIDGPFRESCGGHFFNGYDITPFYLRRPLTKLRDAINLANQIRRWSEIPGLGILDPELEDLWVLLKGFVPEELRGGVELGSDLQLVDRGFPRFRLTPVRSTSENGLGGYLLWLNTCKDTRSTDGSIQTSIRSLEKGIYRYGRVRAGGRRTPYSFISEL